MEQARAGFQALIFCSVSVSFWLLTPGSAGAANTSDDGRVVYCLARDQRSKLVDAAVALGLTRHGSGPDIVELKGRDSTIEAWRKASGHDFDTACRALVAARDPDRSSPANPLLTSLATALQVLVGALIGLVATAWRARVDWGRQQADELRRAGREFDAAVRSYVREAETVSSREAAEPLRMARATLSLRLRGLAGRRRRWARPGALTDDLETGVYGPALADGWERDIDSQRAKDLTDGLQAFGRRVEELAAALERPFHRNPEMRVR